MPVTSTSGSDAAESQQYTLSESVGAAHFTIKLSGLHKATYFPLSAVTPMVLRGVDMLAT